MSFTISEETHKAYTFLNVLRETGVTNMFGAAPYLVEHLGVDRRRSHTLLAGWMQSFNENGYDHLLEKEA